MEDTPVHKALGPGELGGRVFTGPVLLIKHHVLCISGNENQDFPLGWAVKSLMSDKNREGKPDSQFNFPFKTLLNSSTIVSFESQQHLSCLNFYSEKQFCGVIVTLVPPSTFSLSPGQQSPAVLLTQIDISAASITSAGPLPCQPGPDTITEKKAPATGVLYCSALLSWSSLWAERQRVWEEKS